MKRLEKAAWILALGLVLVGAQATAAYGKEVTTLHVEVVEDHGSEAKVSLTMPLDLLEAFASSIETEDARDVLVELEDEGFDLRKFWQEVRDADIREFFTLDVEDAHIRAWREDGLFRVSVDAEESEKRGKFGDRATVNIQIPEKLMDYLVNETEELTPEDLLQSLREFGPITLVEVESENESVRVWLE
jgi:hypothetical protein